MLKTLRRSLLLSMVWTSICAFSESICHVTGSELSKFLHAALEEHQGRTPTGAEMYYYSNLSREGGPLESYIGMASSYDYFVRQCGQDPQVYVTQLFQLFLNRQPRPDELRFWVNQFLASGANRTEFVRQFCSANNIYTGPGAPSPAQPVFRPPGAPAGIADALVAKVRLLTDMVRRELGGTRFGQALLNDTAILQSASAQYRDAISSSLTTPQQLAIAVDNVERSLQQVDARFRTVPAVSDPCRNVLWEISQLVASARNAAATLPSQPSAGTPLQRDIEQLLVVLRDFSYAISHYQNQSPFYANLNRDVNGLYVQVQALQQLARTTQRPRDLERTMTSINTQGREIGRQLVRDADFTLRQGWWHVQHQLEEVTLAAGCGGDLYVSSAHPVVINRPGWTEFPGQISTGHQYSASNREIVSQADQLVSLIEGYYNSLRPVATRNREAATMMNQTLDLRHDVLVLRQQAASGAFDAELRYASRDVVRQYSDVASQTFARMVGGDSTLNSPTWAQIGQLAYQIDKAISGR